MAQRVGGGIAAALEGGEWSAAHPGRTLPPGKIRYPFYRRLVLIYIYILYIYVCVCVCVFVCVCACGRVPKETVMAHFEKVLQLSSGVGQLKEIFQVNMCSEELEIQRP